MKSLPKISPIASTNLPSRSLPLRSVLFAAVHVYSAIGLVTIVVYGMGFCWLYARSGSLWPGIVAHAAINFVLTTQTAGWFSLH